MGRSRGQGVEPLEPVRVAARLAAVTALALLLAATAFIPVARAASSIALAESGTTAAHVGDPATLTFTATNPGDGPLHDVVVTSEKCTPTLGGGDGNGNSLLDTTETWTYGCSFQVPSGDIDPIVDTSVVSALDTSDVPVGASSGHQIDVIHQGMHVVASPSKTQAHVGDSVTYTYTVTNTGDARLGGVGIGDPKCSAPPAGPTGDTNGNTFLDIAETWTYTCSHTVVSGDGDPLHDVVSVSADDPLGGGASDTDAKDVDILHPSVDLATDATVATAHVGDTVTFLFTITNGGDALLSGVAIGGSTCDGGTMSAKTGDSNGNNKLDTSETWTTHCTRVVQQADGSPLHNVGTVSAADAIGGPTSASDSADVAIVALATPSPSPTIEASIEPSPEPSTEPTPDETAIVGASEAPTSPSTAPGSTVTAGGGPGPGATASPGAAPTGSDDGPLNLLILVLIVALGTGAIGAYLNARRRQPELADGAFVRSRAGFDDERDPNIGGEPGEPPRYVAPERPVRVRRRPPRSP